MQHSIKEYRPKDHRRFKGLTIKQPWADKILNGEKTIELRKMKTTYRGDIVITSSKDGTYRGGVTICHAELFDCIPFDRLTDDEKFDTGIPESDWHKFSGYYAWKLRNVKPLNMMPVKGQLGIWNLVVDKNDLIIPDDRPEKFIKYAKWIIGLVAVSIILTIIILLTI